MQMRATRDVILIDVQSTFGIVLFCRLLWSCENSATPTDGDARLTYLDSPCFCHPNSKVMLQIEMTVEEQSPMQR
jgi:hypothetical protein